MTAMDVMVTGGAGYIGSVIAARLLAAGHRVTVFDDLSRGHAAAVPDGADLAVGDIRDGERLTAAMKAARCAAVVHMAALAEVAESVAFPERYRDVNTEGTRRVAEAALAAGATRLVFSSTAAVYGAPERVPIDEDATLSPTNPYGDSKLAAERLLGEAAAASGGRLAVMALRYFNAAGSDGVRGEDHDPETHLVPLALAAARDGRPQRVFGIDYPTPDGTCVRDYVHVSDLAAAHVAALERLPRVSGACNLGTGSGSSVREVLRAVEAATGRTLTEETAPRRAGDPPVLVASNGRAREVLGWRPRVSLDEIVADAWRWMQEHPRGYDDRGASEQ
jgi:UDP-glucose-4-epimerase GalE